MIKGENALSCVDEYKDIEGPDRYDLQIRKVLNSIKEKFYELTKHTADWIAEERDSQIERWLSWLQNLTEPIKSQRVKEAPQEIQNEGINDGRKRQRDENDDE